MKEESQTKIIEEIILNRQAGETFSVKMANSARVLLGIPMPSTSDPDKFMMDLANPEPGRTGTLFEGNFQDIEFIEKV